MWLVKLAVILLEGWVAKDTLEEVTAHRKSGSGSLTQGSGAEVETAVFASYPGTNYELRAHTHEPSIGVVIGGTCLATELCITVVAYIAPETLGCTSRLLHTAL